MPSWGLGDGLWRSGPSPEAVKEIALRAEKVTERIMRRVRAEAKAEAVAERDAELNRWRDPAQPDWVVYPLKDGAVRALNEATLSVIFRRYPEYSESYQRTPGNRAILAWIEAGKPLSPACDKCGGRLGRIGECRCMIEAIRARLQERRSEVLPDSVITDPSVVEDSPLPPRADLDHTYCVRCCPDPANHVHSYCGETAGDGDTIDSGAPANCPKCLAFDGCPDCGLGARQEPPA